MADLKKGKIIIQPTYNPWFVTVDKNFTFPIIAFYLAKQT